MCESTIVFTNPAGARVLSLSSSNFPFLSINTPGAGCSKDVLVTAGVSG